MEPAGLAVGSAGLGVLFGQVVRAWGFLSAQRSFAEEFALQQIKLDIEKTLFLQWGRRMGLIVPEDESAAVVDFRISDTSATQKAVGNILLTMKNLMNDSSNLQSKYGIVIEDGTEIEAATRGVSNSLMDAFESWQRQVATQQNGSTTWQKKAWVCWDHDKFITFVNEMNSFNLKLTGLTPPGSFIHQLLVQQIVQSLRSDLSTLNLVRMATAKSHPDLSKAAKQQIIISESIESPVATRELLGDEGGLEQMQGGEVLDSQLHKAPKRVPTPDDIVNLVGQGIDAASSAIKMLINSPIRKHQHKGETHTPIEQLYTLTMRLDLQKYKLKSLALPERMIEDLGLACRDWVEQVRRVKKSATQVAKTVPRYPEGVDVTLEQNALAVEADLELLRTNLECIVTNTFATI